MKYTFAFASLVATTLAGECYAPAPVASSAPAPSASSAPAADSMYYTVIASRSGSPIHLLSLTARGNKFYLGGEPSSYCPTSTVGASSCPSGNSTVFTGGDKTLNLGVVAPGGQQVYVTSTGELSYTTPHSGFTPSGAITDEFTKTAPTAGSSFGTLSFEQGFVACPVKGSSSEYEVYGQTQDFKAASDCLGFSALTSSADGPGAYEY